jgi:ubiquinone/menaquinone biosynthesis C-methylase UbiE
MQPTDSTDNPELSPTNEASRSDSPALGYAVTWLQPDDLDSLNARLHDGVPVDQLLNRARRYRDTLFSAFPEAAPQAGDRMLELGSGVGWIMEAMLERFSPREIIGLDISANMVARAQERFSDPRARFVLYDGRHMPFPDSEFQVLYSVAAMQHIEKHVAFLLFEELHRVLAVGGHAIIHLLSIDHLPRSALAYHDECLNHVDNVPTHWHHYYTFDELFLLFSDAIGVTELDIVPSDDFGSFLVHFSRTAGGRYRREELPALTFRARMNELPARRDGPASTPVWARYPTSGAILDRVRHVRQAVGNRVRRRPDRS